MSYQMSNRFVESEASSREFSDKNEDEAKGKGEDGHEVTTGISSVIAEHYNNLEEAGREIRKLSRIYYLRNFNNWIKSMLIKEYLKEVQDSKKEINAKIKVLDMCCGKGGDLLKWKIGNIKYLICADIAETSVEQCKQRYQDMKNKNDRGWKSNLFESEFIVADCTKVRLREKYQDVTINLDLVSCQFSFHYCFESLPQAECMLKNAAECLQPGGYFIGTIPDSAEIVKRVKSTGTNIYKNDLLQIELCCEEPYALFGAKYNFYLEGVVDCPEFLVHFPTLVKLAARFGLKLVRREGFCQFYEKMKDDGMFLMKRMQVLETYPPARDAKLVGELSDYEHADKYLKNSDHDHVGTLSKSEWEAISLYQLFVFQKVKTKWNEEGQPVFD